MRLSHLCCCCLFNSANVTCSTWERAQTQAETPLLVTQKLNSFDRFFFFLIDYLSQINLNKLAVGNDRLNHLINIPNKYLKINNKNAYRSIMSDSLTKTARCSKLLRVVSAKLNNSLWPGLIDENVRKKSWDEDRLRACLLSRRQLGFCVCVRGLGLIDSLSLLVSVRNWWGDNRRICMLRLIAMRRNCLRGWRKLQSEILSDLNMSWWCLAASFCCFFIKFFTKIIARLSIFEILLMFGIVSSIFF